MESVFRKLCRLIHGDGPKVYKCISTQQTRNSDSNFYEAQPKDTCHVYLDDRCTAQTIIKTPAERTAVKNPIENITSTQTHQKKKIYILENRNRTKNKEKLEKRKYNENDGYKKKHKNGLLPLLFKFMVCGSVILCGASASHTKQRVTKRLLTSYTCSLRKFYSLTPECHKGEFAYNTTILNCQFRELCNSHENPVCLETENMVVFVCLKKDISCEKGRMIKASQDVADRYIVHLEEVNCPNGTYQPIDSECINACSYRHLDVADMDERFVLSSRGDNISPTYVYYGLCVSECEHGFDRNPPDFLCRPMGSSVNISTTTTDRTLTQGTSLISTTQSSTEGINTTNFRGRTSIKTITADDENDNITNEAVPWWHYLLYCCVGIVVFSIIGACIYKRQSLLECLNRKRRRHDHTVNYKFEKVDTVNICNCAEPHVPGF